MRILHAVLQVSKKSLVIAALFVSLDGGTICGAETQRSEDRRMDEVRTIFLRNYTLCFQAALNPKLTNNPKRSGNANTWGTLATQIEKLSARSKAEAAVMYYFGLPLQGEKTDDYLHLFFRSASRDKADQQLVDILDAVPESEYATLCKSMEFPIEKAASFKRLLKEMRRSQ